MMGDLRKRPYNRSKIFFWQAKNQSSIRLSRFTIHQLLLMCIIALKDTTYLHCCARLSTHIILPYVNLGQLYKYIQIFQLLLLVLL